MKLKLSILFTCTLFCASAQDSSNYHLSLRLFGSTCYPYSGSKRTDIDLSKQPRHNGTAIGLQTGIVRKVKNFRPSFSLGYYFYTSNINVYDSARVVITPPNPDNHAYLTSVYFERLNRHVMYAQLSGGMKYTLIRDFSIGWDAGIRFNSQITEYARLDSSANGYTMNYTHSLHNKLLNYVSWNAAIDFYVPEKNSSLFVGYTGGFSYYLVYFNFGVHHSFPLKKKITDAEVLVR